MPIIILLKFTGEGEIFFLQERIGKNGEIFKLFKLATMLKDSPNIGSKTITIQSDPRVLPVGKVLRKTKINELPQLLNILIGNMSFIGPRPLTEETFALYKASTKSLILTVRPGLSGIGSIVFREEEKILKDEAATQTYYDEVIAPYKGALEEWFVMNNNTYIYILSILITFWVVLFPESSIIFKIFPKLPRPPAKLKILLNYK